jgi:hypothetical protein
MPPSPEQPVGRGGAEEAEPLDVNASANGDGTAGADVAGKAGSGEVRADEAPPGDEACDAENARVAPAGAVAGDSGPGGVEGDSCDRAKAGDQLPGGNRHAPKELSDREFALVVKAGNGNTKLIGRLLNRDHSYVRRRIARTPKLAALYSNRAEGGEVVPLDEGATLIRDPAEIPSAPPDGKLAQMVEKSSKLVRDDLLKLGVPQTTINKLKAFDGLAIDAGWFLVQSLQDTHQIYYINLLRLDAMAEDIKRRYLDEEATEKPEAMERMFWQRAYNEIVDQLGKGHDRMLAGTQAVAAIMRAQTGDKGKGKGAKAKPGW